MESHCLFNGSFSLLIKKMVLIKPDSLRRKVIVGSLWSWKVESICFVEGWEIHIMSSPRAVSRIEKKSGERDYGRYWELEGRWWMLWDSWASHFGVCVVLSVGVEKKENPMEQGKTWRKPRSMLDGVPTLWLCLFGDVRNSTSLRILIILQTMIVLNHLAQRTP